MTFTKLSRAALLVITGALLSGCVPSAPSQLDEEKEPHFLSGKSRLQQMDYRGAIESFEKALEVNPQSASAHFELGCLYEQKEVDPAAAIYHFDRFLKLRPKTENAEIVKQHIMACKQELARTIMLGPLNEKVQREVDHLAEENKRLTEELEKWRVWGRSQTNLALAPAAPGRTTTATTTTPVLVAISSPTAPSSTNLARAAVASPAGRTHTVKAGETFATIARKYGVKVDALMAANPRLDPRRLKIGQTLSIPGS